MKRNTGIIFVVTDFHPGEVSLILHPHGNLYIVEDHLWFDLFYVDGHVFILLYRDSGWGGFRARVPATENVEAVYPDLEGRVDGTF